ncbi:MAG: class I SAM-dependent methyltransferase [Candidatus Pacebacteria bacterium]|nr:class I SAM-dependent methyltransferase [Candidatus Paceibacterota bacterium]
MFEKKFTKDVKIPRKVIKPDWDDITANEEEAAQQYHHIESSAQALGFKLTNSKVLEIGSGKALLLDYAKKNGIDIIGLDVEHRGSKDSPQVTARIEQLPFPSETFDIIYSSFIFDPRFYDNDVGYIFDEIHRVLKDGGIYIAREPHLRKEYENFKLEMEYPPQYVWRKMSKTVFDISKA